MIPSRARRVLAVAFVVLGIASSAPGGTYLYALNTAGKVSVNGNTINNLPGDFDPSEPSFFVEQAWRDLVTVAGDQYALRGDGAIYRNGAKQWRLPYDTRLAWFWIDLEVVGATTYALRQDGELAANAGVVAELPRDGFVFTALQVRNGVTYALRSDGSVFRNTATTPSFEFRAGAGLVGAADGDAVDTVWIALRVSPDGSQLYALRRDGALYRSALPDGPQAGESVESFPFPTALLDFNQGDLYSDLEFDEATGDWVVLALDGRVYRAPNAVAAADDFPGNGNNPDSLFAELAVANGSYFALRSDGFVYAAGGTNELLRLAGNDYGWMQVSADPPVLAGQKNNEPDVVTYKIKVNTGGQPVKIPVVATDVETPTAALVITPVTVPAGGVWNAAAHQLTWTTPAVAGKYEFAYIVDDGQGSARTYTSTIDVRDPDASPEKNKGPYIPKLKGAGALVGATYRVHIPRDDPDGDPVTITVNPLEYPFTSGAVYEPATSDFVWTPSDADLGKQTIEFQLSDGVTTSQLKLKLEVRSPLHIPPLAE